MLKVLVIIIAAVIFAYYANLAFQGEFSGSEAVNEFFLE